MDIYNTILEDDERKEIFPIVPLKVLVKSWMNGKSKGQVVEKKVVEKKDGRRKRCNRRKSHL